MQQIWTDHPHHAAKRRTAALLAPGYTFVADNLGWVGENILEKIKCQYFRLKDQGTWMTLRRGVDM